MQRDAREALDTIFADKYTHLSLPSMQSSFLTLYARSLRPLTIIRGLRGGQAPKLCRLLQGAGKPFGKVEACLRQRDACAHSADPER